MEKAQKSFVCLVVAPFLGIAVSEPGSSGEEMPCNETFSRFVPHHRFGRDLIACLWASASSAFLELFHASNAAGVGDAALQIFAQQLAPRRNPVDAKLLSHCAIDATAVEKLVVEPVEAPVASTLPVAVLAPSATTDTPDSAAVATEFVIDLDVSDNEAASVTHDSTPDGAQSPVADGLFNAIDNLGATR
ncbi:hypothetical protein DFJ73DRAFT_771263 [Zopfochytrium polystomum]|nr:hypothetical protein DFJ73DRAFT_771263 [Zopfochytrium polystomum]